MVNKKLLWIIAIVVILVVGAAGAYMLTQKNASAPSNSKTPTDSSKTATATITYSGSSFSPNSVTVKSGDTVAIKNTSSDTLEFDSNPHPVHTDNTELNVGSVAPGEGMTFTVTTKGTYHYHNHLDASQGGTIIVE
jgi:plastocyanin